MKTKSILLIIDVQEKFRNVIHEFNSTISNTKKLIDAFNVLDIPIIVTEQYPKGLGKTVKELSESLDIYNLVEKTSFDCFNNDDFLKTLHKKNKNNLIICGIESHICVFQTVLSALKKGFNVHIIYDGISSRKQIDYNTAIKRMQNEGAKLSTTEMIIFQMIKDSNDEKFKELSQIIK